MEQKTIYEVFKSFSGELDPKTLQRKFLDALLKMHNVERGSIWIRTKNYYLCIEAAGEESEKVRGVRLDSGQKSIVGWVIENGEMAVARPGDDPRHYKEIEQELAVKSDLIVAFPLFLKDESVYGAVEVIDTCGSPENICLEDGHLEQIQELVNIGSVALSNALDHEKQIKEKESLQSTLDEIRGEREDYVGQSIAFQAAVKLLTSYAKTDYHVLISGESGTGKEIAAHKIHDLSSRKGNPFVAQNCGAIPETLLESELFGYKKGAFSGADKDKPGLFELANKGTIFLDEITELPLQLQAKLLRVAQESEFMPLGGTVSKKVDVRIVAATNRDLEEMVASHLFRQDLFYRLSTLPLGLPPLRERKGDIPLLFAHFLRKEGLQNNIKEKRLLPDALKILSEYTWPGNIRELENFAKYITVVCSSENISGEDLPLHLRDDDELTEELFDFVDELQDEVPEPLPPREKGSSAAGIVDFSNMTWAEVEKSYVEFLLNKNYENVTWAAEDAGVNRSTFVSRMKRIGIACRRKRRKERV